MLSRVDHARKDFAMRAVGKTAFLWTMLAAALAAPAGAEVQLCDDPTFSIDAPDIATHVMICRAASDAREVLEECGLSQTQQIAIEVVERPIHHIGECLAAFDCSENRIQIIDPDLLRDHLEPGDAYAALPNDVVFRSLLTHEMAHALVNQSAEGRTIAPIDHEYIANALELAALPREHRRTLLEAAGIEPLVSAEEIDIFIYGLAPRRFAAVAYLYFQEHGCETVMGIVDGSASFQTER